MSRASVIGMLVAVEVLIVGMAIYAVRAGGDHAWFGWGARSASSAGGPIAPMAAGPAPLVTIDDTGARVRVMTSQDGLVHVSDETQAYGLPFGGQRPQLRVARTSGGVRIDRPGGPWLHFGFFDERIAVAVPPGAQIDIAHCSSAEVSDVTGGASVHCDDGHITLSGLKGRIDASSGDGAIDVTDARVDALRARSSDGSISLRRVSTASLIARTEDGAIRVRDLTLSPGENNELSTADGSIELAPAPPANLAIDASTEDGSIVVDGTRYSGDDSVHRSIRLGNGAASLKLSTADGSIHITTNGA